MEPVYTSHLSNYPTKKEIHGVNLEDALNIVGLGRHQWLFAAIGGLAFLAAGVQSGISAFILPSMKCDMALTSSQMGLLNALFLLGGIGSGVVWGAVVDSIGRKPVLLIGLFLDSVVTVLSAISPNFYVFLVFRFFSGFIIGGPASVCMVHVGELIPQKYRAQVLCYTGLTWSASWVVTAGLAWIIMPLDSWIIKGIEISSWRYLILVVAFIDLIAAIAYSTVYESPKFYLSQGNVDMALKVLSNVYAQNKGVSADDFPVKSLAPLENSQEKLVDCANKSVWRPLVATLKQFKTLLHGKALSATGLACFLWFSNMFGYYGLGLWMPELASRYKTFEASNGKARISVCELSSFQVSGHRPVSCKNIDPSVFTNTLVSGVSLVSGNLMAALLMSRLPRRFMPVFFMFGAAVCVLGLFIVRSSTEYLIATSLFQLSIGTANLVHNALVVDIFPPEVCGRAICMAIMMGRVGAMISNLALGSLLDISCAVPLIMSATFIAAGGFASFFIPRPYEEPSIKSLPVSPRSTA
uniref:Major facilitator superfamily (MFS) profile domain-containing protein n=1 Tax=Lygus hesperus TaxID=30085 RepID=A0A0K8SJZ1_LYGHE